jgi:four helix bundle protein
MDRNEKSKGYQDLVVWQRAMDLVVRCYEMTSAFPRGEQFGLTSQLQRAAVSVPANIAEGAARHHTNEFLHHLSFAYGSLAEVETHLHIARRLGYLEDSDVESTLMQTQEIGRMLNGLRRSLSTGRPTTDDRQPATDH